ncbi:MAG: hypothetical protein K8U57_07515 [Planctomycetes bacterium]|nr:hypothetical protein [Planctomycetota bacterium]
MENLPAVTLAGQAFPVKPLVIYQLRVVVPAILRLTNMVPTAITEEQYADLTEVVYQAIAPAQSPPLSRDGFMNMPVSLAEMIASLDVIAEQAGLVRRAAPLGEAEAASPSTGTPS